MLKKPQRINKTRELQRVYRLGKTVHTATLVIKFVSAAESRVGFVVSKKVSKKAVERNRVKRVLREEFRKSISQIRTGDYMIVVKPPAAVMQNVQLREEFHKAVGRIY